MAATNTSSTKGKKASTKKNDAPVVDQSLAQLEAELNGGETITPESTIPGALVADGGVEGGVDGADLLAELLGEAEIIDNANAVPAAPLPAPERGAGAGRVAGAGALAAGSGVTSGVVTGRTSAAEDGEEAVGAPDGLEGGVRPSRLGSTAKGARGAPWASPATPAHRQRASGVRRKGKVVGRIGSAVVSPDGKIVAF